MLPALSRYTRNINSSQVILLFHNIGRSYGRAEFNLCTALFTLASKLQTLIWILDSFFGSLLRTFSCI